MSGIYWSGEPRCDIQRMYSNSYIVVFVLSCRNAIRSPTQPCSTMDPQGEATSEQQHQKMLRKNTRGKATPEKSRQVRTPFDVYGLSSVPAQHGFDTRMLLM